MRNMLLLRVNPFEDQRWSWLHLDATGVARGVIHTGSLSQAAAEASGLRVIALLPAADCLLTRVRVPGRSRKKLLQAAPYVLEEQLSDDVENLHFSIGVEMDDGDWQVAVTNKQRIEIFMAAFAEAGLEVQQLIPEQLAVPFSKEGSSVLIDQDMAIVRDGKYSGFAVDRENLGIVLATGKQDDDEVPAVLQLYVEQDEVLDLGDGYPGESRVEHYAGDPLSIFSQGLDTKSINLLQGEFGRADEWSRIWRPWRATAALLLASVFISKAVMAVDYYHLKNESEQLKINIEETFRKTFPDTRRLVNPRAQMQQKLDQMQNRQGTGNRFLDLIGQAGAVLKETKGVEVTGANFRGGRLDLDLMVTSLQLLDQLKQALAKDNKLSVEIQSATTESDQRIKSRLRITGVGG